MISLVNIMSMILFGAGSSMSFDILGVAEFTGHARRDISFYILVNCDDS
jgi:hypothetical protein